MNKANRIGRFRSGVYGSRLSYGCRVLLLRLADSMDASAKVSIPRARLAEELRCDPSRISEWVAEAKKAGYLSQVRRGRPGVTAVYQGLYVPPDGCGNRTTSHGADFLTRLGAESAPPEVRKPLSQEVTGNAAVSACPDRPNDWHLQEPPPDYGEAVT